MQHPANLHNFAPGLMFTGHGHPAVRVSYPRNASETTSFSMKKYKWTQHPVPSAARLMELLRPPALVLECPHLGLDIAEPSPMKHFIIWILPSLSLCPAGSQSGSQRTATPVAPSHPFQNVTHAGST